MSHAGKDGEHAMPMASGCSRVALQWLGSFGRSASSTLRAYGKAGACMTSYQLDLFLCRQT